MSGYSYSYYFLKRYLCPLVVCTLAYHPSLVLCFSDLVLLLLERDFIFTDLLIQSQNK